MQALAGEVGMSAELDELARSLYNGQIPSIWRALAPATLKSLGNWILHFLKRNEQYVKWVGVLIADCSDLTKKKVHGWWPLRGVWADLKEMGRLYI